MPVSLQLVQSGGVGMVTWSVQGLPPGLTCDSFGLIAGAPAPSGVAAHFITVTATDGNFASDTVSFTWTTMCRVPAVVGLRESEAVADLRAAGLSVGPHTLNSQCLDVAGAVITQSYPGDVLLPEATQVRLSVSTGRDRKTAIPASSSERGPRRGPGSRPRPQDA